MKCVSFVLILTILFDEAYQSSNDAKTLFKKLFIKHLLKHSQNRTSKPRKAVDLRSVIHNITETRLIDDLAQKMIDNFLRKKLKRNRARTPSRVRARALTPAPHDSLEIIDIML